MKNTMKSGIAITTDGNLVEMPVAVTASRKAIESRIANRTTNRNHIIVGPDGLVMGTASDEDVFAKTRELALAYDWD